MALLLTLCNWRFKAQPHRGKKPDMMASPFYLRDLFCLFYIYDNEMFLLYAWNSFYLC